MVRRVQLQRIWDRGEAGIEDLESPRRLSAEPSPEAAARWVRLALTLNEADQEAAKAFVVARARRIWGRLGGLLSRSSWAQEYRKERLMPLYIIRFVKRWIPIPRAD